MHSVDQSNCYFYYERHLISDICGPRYREEGRSKFIGNLSDLIFVVSQVKSFKKLTEELEDSLAMLKESSVVDEENSPAAKQLASLRVSLDRILSISSGAVVF